MAEIILFQSGGYLTDIQWGDKVDRDGNVVPGSKVDLSMSDDAIRGLIYFFDSKGITQLYIGLANSVVAWPAVPSQPGTFSVRIIGSPASVTLRLALSFSQGRVVKISSVLSKSVCEVGDTIGPFEAVYEDNVKAISLDDVKLSSYDKMRLELEDEIKKLQQSSDPQQEMAMIYDALLKIAEQYGLSCDHSTVLQQLETELTRRTSDISKLDAAEKKAFNDWQSLMGLAPSDLTDANLTIVVTATKKKIRDLEQSIAAQSSKADLANSTINRIQSEAEAAYKRTFGGDAPSFENIVDSLTAYLMPVTADKSFQVQGPRAAFCISLLDKIETARQQLVDIGRPPTSEFPRDLEGEVARLQNKLTELRTNCEVRKKVLTDKIRGEG